MANAAITATGFYLPEGRMTNADLEKLVDTTDEWITTRTGIKERRILKDPTKATAFMASEAAKNLIEKKGVDPEEIDAIIVATVTPDMFFPATACLVQAEIGATNAIAFDLSAACSGFLFALINARACILSGQYKKVLVIGADKMSSILDYTDRTTCILFGDAAACALVEPTDDGMGIIDDYARVDGNYPDLLCMTGGGSLNPPSVATIEAGMHFIHQEGRAVFKHAVTGMADAAGIMMDRNELTGEDVRYLVPHQANLRIIDATANRMDISRDKIMLNIHRYGNTTAATIPLCLADWENELRKGDNLILAAFGGGFTWGAIYLKWAYDGSVYPKPEHLVNEDFAPVTA